MKKMNLKILILQKNLKIPKNRMIPGMMGIAMAVVKGVAQILVQGVVLTVVLEVVDRIVLIIAKELVLKFADRVVTVAIVWVVVKTHVGESV